MRRLLIALIVLVVGGLGLIQLGYFDLGPVVITREEPDMAIGG